MTSFDWWSSLAGDDEFLCCLCFECKPISQAWQDEHGQKWDTCKACEDIEQELLTRREQT